MSEPRLVVFDVDGTLVDSQHHIVEAMRRGFSSLGRPAPSRDATLSIVGLSLGEAMARLLPGADETEVTAAAEAYRAAYLEMRAEEGPDGAAPLYPGTRAALEALHARPEVLLGAATGMARRGLDHIFGVHGIDGLFVTRQTADLHPSKPHPAMLHAALSETGVTPDRAVMVGDTTYDMEMARAAGVAAIGVSWGYHAAADLMAAGARMVVDTFADLAPAIEAIWREA